MARTSASPSERSAGVIEWLLDGDPAIRWQVFRDLANAPAPIVEEERRRVSSEGWGARLLASQDKDGRWAGLSSNGGLYSPKWISTTYTMLLLRDFGLHPGQQTQSACSLLLDRGIHRDGGINYGWRGGSETCVTGIVTSILCHFEYQDDRLDELASHLLGQQMLDGGWNCRRAFGATHSSVHTTINVLEGLRFYESYRGRNVRKLQNAQRRGREFLLAHRLFRSHRTGAVIKRAFTMFSFPPRWYYDILRALDYFQAVSAPRDPRLQDAIDSRRRDGTWLLQNVHKGKTYFELEPAGQPSRWNTLRALRVLKWWDRSKG